MSQVVMNELVNMSQEIIKLKDQKYELVAALRAMLDAFYEDPLDADTDSVIVKAFAAIESAAK